MLLEITLSTKHAGQEATPISQLVALVHEKFSCPEHNRTKAIIKKYEDFVTCYKMFFIVICLLSSVLFNYVDSTNFDQRQIGDVNVQVDVNDVQIFAVMKGSKEEEYMDYDYTYDYSEFTIKPQNRTTPKPLKGTTSSTEPNSLKYNLTTALPIVQEHTTGSLISDSTTLDTIVSTINFDGDNKTTEINTADIGVTKKTFTTTTPKPTKIKCKKGFFLNKEGVCQLQLNNTGNALLKLVQLSQRLKLRRENKRNDNS